MQFGDYVLDFFASLWLAVGFFVWELGSIFSDPLEAAQHPMKTLLSTVAFILIFIVPSVFWFIYSMYTNRELTMQKFFPTRFLLAVVWIVLLLWLVSQQFSV